MSIQYVRVTKKDSTFFEFLDPYEKLRILSLPFGFAMGALSEEGEELIPAGLLVAAVSDEALITEWLAVASDQKGEGIGEGLLYRAFEAASELGLKTIKAVFLPEYEKETALKYAKNYFEKRLFTKKYEAGLDADLLISDIRTQRIKRDCMTLSEMTSVEKRKCIERLGAMENATYTFSPVMLLPGLDNHISVVCKNGNALEGGLLCCVAGDTIYPLYHYAGTKEISDSMIATAVAAAKSKYGHGMNVTVMMRQPGMDEALSQFFGNKIFGTILEADVREFEDSLRADI